MKDHTEDNDPFEGEGDDPPRYIYNYMSRSALLDDLFFLLLSVRRRRRTDNRKSRDNMPVLVSTVKKEILCLILSTYRHVAGLFPAGEDPELEDEFGNGGLPELKPVRPAAALPMENPYCSCKLTRARPRGLQLRSLWKIPTAAVSSHLLGPLEQKAGVSSPKEYIGAPGTAKTREGRPLPFPL